MPSINSSVGVAAEECKVDNRPPSVAKVEPTQVSSKKGKDLPELRDMLGKLPAGVYNGKFHRNKCAVMCAY